MPTITQAPVLKSLFESSKTPHEYVTGFIHHMSRIIRNVDTGAVANLIEWMEEACDNGRRIFLMGNGGSSAVASHMVADLGPNSWADGRPGYKVICLSDNVESITAIANDSGYENIFAFQLRCCLQPGDLVIAFSVSGNSENIIRGVEVANQLGGRTIGLTGLDGGRLRNLCDMSIHVPSSSDEYGPVEDLFSCIGHIVTGFITMKRGRVLYH